MPRGKKKSTRARGGNSCCPVIRVKCQRPGKLGGGLGGLLDRVPWFQAAKAAKAARQASTGDAAASAAVFMKADMTSTERRLALKAKRAMCTIRAGGIKRRVNIVNLKSAVAKIANAQKKHRCIPKVVKG